MKIRKFFEKAFINLCDLKQSSPVKCLEYLFWVQKIGFYLIDKTDELAVLVDMKKQTKVKFGYY